MSSALAVRGAGQCRLLQPHSTSYALEQARLTASCSTACSTSRTSFVSHSCSRQRRCLKLHAQNGDNNELSKDSQRPSEEDDTTVAMKEAWEGLKKELKKDLAPEEAQKLDAITVDDLTDTNGFMRKMADEQLGPILSSMGITENPYTFFVELIKLATCLQLATCGVVFYGTELWGHFDAGEAFRAVTGLGVGYLTRPLFKVEQVLWPIYQLVLESIVPTAVYETVTATAEDKQALFNKLGVTMAIMFFMPKYFWGWDTEQCLQFVIPMATGWFLFDLAYMLAMLMKLKMI